MQTFMKTLCCGFEHAAVTDRHPVDGCNTSTLSMICNNTCKSILNTLQLVLIGLDFDLFVVLRRVQQPGSY